MRILSQTEADCKDFKIYTHAYTNIWYRFIFHLLAFWPQNVLCQKVHNLLDTMINTHAVIAILKMIVVIKLIIMIF